MQHTVYLKARHLATRKGFIKATREAFAFPDYFGENLDAVWDCMTDLGWWSAGDIRVEVAGSGSAAASPGFDWKGFLEEVQRYWTANGLRQFEVVIRG